MKTYIPDPEFRRVTRSAKMTSTNTSTTTTVTTTSSGASIMGPSVGSTTGTTTTTTTATGTTTTAGASAAPTPSNQGRPDLQFLKFDTNICEKFDPNSTDAHTWLHKFMALATFAKWSNEQICFFFGLHLLKDAYTWFSNLPIEISQNFDKIKEQFIVRFGLNGATKWSILPEIYEMKQKPDQTVQDFIQKVQIKSKLIDLPEDQVIGALMKGFLPQIRSDLIRAKINTIADVIQEATISEQANKIKNNSSESILSEERLVRAIQTAMSINHLQTEQKQNQNTLNNRKQQENSSFHNRSQPFQRQHQHKQNYRPQNLRNQTQNSAVNPNYICFRCDRKAHHYQNQCPYIDAVCYKCSKTGHIQRACKPQ